MSPWPPRPHQEPQFDMLQPSSAPQRTTSQHAANIGYDIPTLHASPASTDRSDNAALRHTRSFSHPFPSLFGSGKKSGKRGSSKNNTDAGVDSTDDESSFLGKAIRLKRDDSLKNKEPLTGRCMTCDATVRWPRDVKTFRCVTCQTINDLEPYTESAKDAHGQTRPAQDGPQRKR